MLELVKSHKEFEECGDRMRTLLIGTTVDVATRVTIGMITAGVFGSITEPHLSDVSDADLQRILLDRAQRLLAVAAEPSTAALRR